MRIELINTGTELMLGQVLNSHQQWLCRQLADLGYTVDRQVAVPDAGPAIQQAVREALAVARLLVVTGGLGPTSDDRTRDQIAELLGRKLREDAAVLAHIEEFFRARQRPMPASTRLYTRLTISSFTSPWAMWPHQIITSVSFTLASGRPCSGSSRVAVETFRSVDLRRCAAIASCMPLG